MELEDKIATAIKHYQRSPNSTTVIEAVDQAFREDAGLFFKEDEEDKLKRKAFIKRLVQIALDNRLGMFNPSSIKIPHSYYYILTYSTTQLIIELSRINRMEL